MMQFRLLFIGLCCIFQAPVSFFSVRLELSPNALHRYSFQHPQMGTVFRVVFFSDKDSTEAASIAGQVFARIDTLNAMFSDWLPESELNRLCKQAGLDITTPVSSELYDILVQSKKFSKQSAGAFDVTVGPLTRLWRRSRSLKELPTEDRIKKAIENVDWQNIGVCRKSRGIRLKKAGMALDLGGIAQGWAADDCLKLLRQFNINHAMVDAGGDIALGTAPPGEMGWKIEVPAPNGDKKLLYLQHCGITTSGATYRYLEFEGKRYSHIIDPRTGMGLTHHTLVTVIAPDATTADAWATAMSVLGEKGRKLAQKSPKKLEIWLTETPM
jgi:thiamine biosynthesis lipoprotein